MNQSVYAISLQSDGKLIVGGYFTAYNGTARPRIARLNSDGTLDPTFAPAGLGTNADVLATALQSDGKVLAGGLFTSFGASTARYLARLTCIGTLD